MSRRRALPADWQDTTLGTVVASMKNGIYKPRDAYADDGVACLRMYNIDTGRIVWRDIKRMRLSADEIREYGLSPGDLLVNRVNSRELVGKTAMIGNALEPMVFESKNIRVRLRGNLANPSFVNYALMEGGTRHFSQNAQQVVGMASISQPQVAAFPLLLPPLPEQQRIVAEIEKQLTRLEAGVAALRRVQANLRRYRATVLKAACEGRLVPTEAELARQEGRGYETSAELLTRIQVARRSAWVARAQCRKPTKYPSPPEPDPAEQSQLPDGWVWATVGQISSAVQYGTSAKTSEVREGIPVLRMGNIQDGRIVSDDLKYLPIEHTEFPELLLEEGDLLFNRTNSAELVGKTAAYFGNPRPCSFASYLIRIRLVPGYSPKLLAFYLNSVFGRAWISRVVSQQVGQANVNGTKLQALAVPLPPLAEQHRIVAEVERRLSVVEELEAAVAANLRRAARLRQAVLQRAFSGRLIPAETA